MGIRRVKIAPGKLKRGAAYAAARDIDGAQDVVLLQMAPVFGADPEAYLVSLVLQVFHTEREQRRKGATWQAFVGRRPHVEGLVLWLGLSRAVPLEVVKLVQGMLEKSTDRVGREMGRPGHYDLLPFAHLDDGGLELLIPVDAVVAPDEFTELLAMVDGEAMVRRARLGDRAGKPRRSQPAARGADQTNALDESADEEDGASNASEAEEPPFEIPTGLALQFAQQAEREAAAGNRETAAVLWNQAAMACPGNPALMINSAQAFARAGRTNEAGRDLLLAAGQLMMWRDPPPRFASTYANLAKWHKGFQPAVAALLLGRAVELDADDAEVQSAVAEFEAADGG